MHPNRGSHSPGLYIDPGRSRVRPEGVDSHGKSEIARM